MTGRAIFAHQLPKHSFFFRECEDENGRQILNSLYSPPTLLPFLLLSFFSFSFFLIPFPLLFPPFTLLFFPLFSFHFFENYFWGSFGAPPPGSVPVCSNLFFRGVFLFDKSQIVLSESQLVRYEDTHAGMHSIAPKTASSNAAFAKGRNCQTISRPIIL